MVGPQGEFELILGSRGERHNQIWPVPYLNSQIKTVFQGCSSVAFLHTLSRRWHWCKLPAYCFELPGRKRVCDTSCGERLPPKYAPKARHDQNTIASQATSLCTPQSHISCSTQTELLWFPNVLSYAFPWAFAHAIPLVGKTRRCHHFLVSSFLPFRCLLLLLLLLLLFRGQVLWKAFPAFPNLSQVCFSMLLILLGFTSLILFIPASWVAC